MISVIMTFTAVRGGPYVLPYRPGVFLLLLLSSLPSLLLLPLLVFPLTSALSAAVIHPTQKHDNAKVSTLR